VCILDHQHLYNLGLECFATSDENGNGSEPDYDEDKDQLEEEQEEETREVTTNQVF